MIFLCSEKEENAIPIFLTKIGTRTFLVSLPGCDIIERKQKSMWAELLKTFFSTNQLLYYGAIQIICD
jgi:hypothetical protein